MFDFMLGKLKAMGFRRIIPWGGVQSNNIVAVKYYQKLGFSTLGNFEYQGVNLDMIRDV